MVRDWATYVGLAGLALLGGRADAGCDGRLYPVERLDHPVLRSVMLSAQSDINKFFDIRLSGFCVDDEAYGPYYDPNDNVIAISTSFMLEVANPPGNINRAISVLAHEGAHAFQGKHDLYDNLRDQDQERVKCIELHADFIAGGYMGWRARRYEIDVKNLTEFFFGLGDEDSEYVGHHGKGPERFLAFRAGFNSGIDHEITLSSVGFGYVSQASCDN